MRTSCAIVRARARARAGVVVALLLLLIGCVGADVYHSDAVSAIESTANTDTIAKIRLSHHRVGAEEIGAFCAENEE